ncbi:hypothetical protein GQ44DRAFT_706950 [Phaeosphaeriaceae sp. PMI808]|nr:hypothetical protein GQ44DRAFT_706950 [Phaeosphaeriaceae sp. PMI808]
MPKAKRKAVAKGKSPTAKSKTTATAIEVTTPTTEATASISKTLINPSSKPKPRKKAKRKAKVDDDDSDVSLPPLYFWKETEAKVGFLSPWYKTPLHFGDVIYDSVGHYIMAEKARIFHDRKTRQKILASKSDEEIKSLGNNVKGFNAETWAIELQGILDTANRKKFLDGAQSKNFMRRLNNLGDRELVFADPADSLIGIGFDAAEASEVSRMKWGKNEMGNSVDFMRRVKKRPHDPARESPFDKFGGKMNVYW